MRCLQTGDPAALALLLDGRAHYPGACFAGLIDPDLPPLPPEARTCLDWLGRTTIGCFVQLRPGRDDPLLVARLLLDPAVPTVGVGGFLPGPGLDGAIRRYWVSRLDHLVPETELWDCAAGLVPLRPAMRPPRRLAAEPAGMKRRLALLSPSGGEPVFAISNTAASAALIRLLRRHGGTAMLSDSCMLAPYACDIEAVRRLAAAELGRVVSAVEAQQWIDGVALPPALFLADIVAAADTVIVHSAWLATEIAARYGKPAIHRPLPAGGDALTPVLSRKRERESLPVVVAQAGGLSADSCRWAATLLADWGVPVQLAFAGADHPAALRLFLAMRGQASLSAALAGAGLPSIASRSVVEAVDVSPSVIVVPDQPSPVVLAEAILHVLGVPARPLPRPAIAASAPEHGVYIDISKLVDEPRRSGIQRVERELIRHWPGPAPLIPCRFDASSGCLRLLPTAILEVLARDAQPGGLAAERRLLAPLLETPGAPVGPDARLLCAELFDDVGRAAEHAARGQRSHWLLFDFLPWLHPEWFPAGPANRLMPYLRTSTLVQTAFISATTRRDFAERIVRGPVDGPVLPLGADGLGLERQHFDPARRDIVMLGTIEARKNAMAALRAFQALWRDGVDARLVLIGAVEPDALAEQALLRELAGEPRLLQCGPLPDAALRDALRRARVLLFPSEGEGYGLPPMEALHCGIPVIVAADLPALAGLAELGQIRLPHADAPAIAGAVRSMLDDGAAERFWADASRISLPSWADFARAVAAWVG